MFKVNLLKMYILNFAFFILFIDSESESSVDSSDIESEPIRKRPFGLDAMKSSNSDGIGFSNDTSNQR